MVLEVEGVMEEGVLVAFIDSWVMGEDMQEQPSPEMLSFEMQNVQPVCIGNHATHSR